MGIELTAFKYLTLENVHPVYAVVDVFDRCEKTGLIHVDLPNLSVLAMGVTSRGSCPMDASVACAMSRPEAFGERFLEGVGGVGFHAGIHQGYLITT